MKTKIQIYKSKDLTTRPYVVEVRVENFPDNARGSAKRGIQGRGEVWYVESMGSLVVYPMEKRLCLPGREDRGEGKFGMGHFVSKEEARYAAKDMKRALENWQKNWKTHIES
jgi:hypothetical protein